MNPRWLLSVLPALMWADAMALCLDGRHPTLRQEFHDSDVVAVGRVLAQRHVSDPDDPAGIARTVYSFQPARVFKGTGKVLRITSENTSSRFPMEKDIDYVVFVRTSAGESSIDACGNSAPVDPASHLVHDIAALAEDRGVGAPCARGTCPAVKR